LEGLLGTISQGTHPNECGSNHIMHSKLVYKYTTSCIGILIWIRTQKQGNKGTAEKVGYTCRYTSGQSPTQSITMTELGIECPQVYLQVYIGNLACLPVFSYSLVSLLFVL